MLYFRINFKFDKCIYFETEGVFSPLSNFQTAFAQFVEKQINKLFLAMHHHHHEPTTNATHIPRSHEKTYSHLHLCPQHLHQRRCHFRKGWGDTHLSFPLSFLF